MKLRSVVNTARSVAIKYRATYTGSLFAILNFAATPTFLVPVLFVFPLGIPAEMFGTIVFNNENSRASFTVAFTTLALIALLHVAWFLRMVFKNGKERFEDNNYPIIFFFIIQMLLVHPAAFYLWASIHPDQAGDGQFFFSLTETFPVSSICLIPMGLAVDLITNRNWGTGLALERQRNVSGHPLKNRT
jgi:hypothetical protein